MADYFLEEIDTILAAQTTEAGDGTAYPTYLGHLPDSTVVDDRAVALLLTEGIGDEARVEIENPGLQVIVRGTTLRTESSAYREASATAFAIKNALHEYSGDSSSGGHRYPGIWNESGPFFLGFDESKRPMFSTNFRVMRSRT